MPLVVVVAVVVVAVVFVVLPAPSTILNSERMSAATLVANSRRAPRCYPEGLLRSAPQARARDTGAGAVSPGTRARGTGRSRGGTAEWAAPRPTAGPCPRRLTSPSHTCHVCGAAMSEALRLASDTSHALSAAFMIVFFDIFTFSEYKTRHRRRNRRCAREGIHSMKLYSYESDMPVLWALRRAGLALHLHLY